MNVKSPIARVNFGQSTLTGPASLQAPSELAEFITMAQEQNVKSYLEIGARYGGTFRAVMEALPIGSRGMAVDFPGGAFGDNKSVAHLLATLSRLNSDGYQVDCVLGPSGSKEVISRVRQAAPFDLVLIDGDHHYDAVKQDWLNYGKLGRIVAIHDIAAEGHKSRAGEPVEVSRLWSEIKDQYRHNEIVELGALMGIGLIWPSEKKAAA